MKQHHCIPIFGLVGSFFVSLLLIHVWLADLLAEMTGISYRTAYAYSIALLVLVTVVRAWRILHDQDEITKWINRLMRK